MRRSLFTFLYRCSSRGEARCRDILLLLRLYRTNKYPAWHPPAPSDYHPRSTAHEPPLQPGTTRKIQKGSSSPRRASTISSEYWHLPPTLAPSYLTSPPSRSDTTRVRSRRMSTRQPLSALLLSFSTEQKARIALRVYG